MRYAGTRPGIPEVLNALFNDTGTVPVSQIWDQHIIPRDSYLLDPVALAIQAGDPRYIAAAQKVAEFSQSLREHPIDRGSAVLDMFLRGMGLDTNLSGLNSPPALTYPIEPGVEYKRQVLTPRANGGQKQVRAPGAEVEFIRFQDTPMADWDLPGPDHRDVNATVRNLGDVEELARSYIKAHPESILRLYQTPGGFRAWELGERMGAQDFQPRFEELNVDGDYARISINPSTKTLDDIPLASPGFASRISHKPGRVDWVAQPLTDLAGAEAVGDPVSIQRIRTYHDEPIRRAYLGGQGASPDAMARLQEQLPSASPMLRRTLAQRFRL